MRVEIFVKNFTMIKSSGTGPQLEDPPWRTNTSYRSDCVGPLSVATATLRLVAGNLSRKQVSTILLYREYVAATEEYFDIANHFVGESDLR